MRRRFARFELCAHLLKTGSERLDLLLLFHDNCFQLFHFAMFFEKLIEQHRVHHFVAYAFHLAFVIAIYQGWIDLFHFFGDQAKGERLRLIILLFQAETHWIQRIQCLARSSERLDVLLVTSRRNNLSMSKPTVAEPDCDVIINACAKRLCSRINIADIGPAVDAGLARNSAPDTNIAIASNVGAGSKPDSGIEATGRVGLK